MSGPPIQLERVEVPGDPAVRGVLHPASGPHGLVLTHGAGGNKDTPLLVAVAEAFAAHGVTVLRCDLPFRQARARGAPSPAGAARDREGLRAALAVLRPRLAGRLFLGGHSYGGRQASMLVAEDPTLASVLLLQSYPLHPPGKPQALRTAHWPSIRTPTLFVHGAGDPFASREELETARALIPARTSLLEGDGGHDLGWGRRRHDGALPTRIATMVLELGATAPAIR
jgi:predicted alpha/beta-hydrolase family hydrolase